MATTKQYTPEQVFDLACCIADTFDNQRSALLGTLVDREGLTHEQIGGFFYDISPEPPSPLTIYQHLLLTLAPEHAPPAWVLSVMKAHPRLTMFAPNQKLHTPGSIWRIEYNASPCGFWFGQIPYGKDWVCGYGKVYEGGDSAREVLVAFAKRMAKDFGSWSGKYARIPMDQIIEDQINFPAFADSIGVINALLSADPENPAKRDQ